MRMRAAAVAACLMALWASVPATAAEKMTLDEAFRRVQQAHPNLRLVDARRDVLSAELDRAELRPSLNLGVGIENVVGTGERSGFDSAETTVTLASVFERGGKLEARRALAQSRIDGVVVEREVKRLDLLAEVARRYLAVVAAQRQREIADLEIEQRRRTNPMPTSPTSMRTVMRSKIRCSVRMVPFRASSFVAGGRNVISGGGGDPLSHKG